MAEISNVVNKRSKRKTIFIALGCGGILVICAFLLASFIVRSCLVVIKPDERGVVISAFEPNGYYSEPLTPGWHWITPFAENVKVYSIAPQTYIMSSNTTDCQCPVDDSIKATTKDGRTVYISVSVVYSLDPTKIIQLHFTWQDRFQEDLVRPLTRSITRNVVLQYNVSETSYRRSDIEKAISLQLGHQFSENDLILEKYTIQDIRIP